MINKTVSFIMVLALLAVTTWCLIFQAYYTTGDEVDRRLALGDWTGAREALENYQANPLSFPVFRLSKLKKYRFRLNYLEGIVYHDGGNLKVAAASFRQAAESQEAAVAAAAKYNLAYYALQENGLDKARSLLNEALLLQPADVGAKINLELTLQKIQDRQQKDLSDEPEKRQIIRPQVTPGEQWRLDVPDEEGEGSGAATGRSYL